jgi:hypothetical protein
MSFPSDGDDHEGRGTQVRHRPLSGRFRRESIDLVPGDRAKA